MTVNELIECLKEKSITGKEVVHIADGPNSSFNILSIYISDDVKIVWIDVEKEHYST